MEVAGRLRPPTRACDEELRDRLRALPPDFARSDQALASFLIDLRELADRRIGLRPYDVQLQAAAAMLRGVSVEMATGEGKTLVGALVATGLVLGGHRVHVLGANDYLARRDADWMGPLLRAVGISVEAVTSAADETTRRAAYRAEVTYVPVTEAGFDTLRDRLRLDPADLVGIGHDAAIVDEADAVLLDEARVPLVLAGEDARRAGTDTELAAFVASLAAGTDYTVDPDRRTLHLTEAGLRRVEQRFAVADLFGADADLLTRVHVALYAEELLRRDVDYVLDRGRVRLVSRSRGRVEALQRWPDGLQAAVEAKERLAPSAGVQILDQLLISDLIGRYGRVVGMSATLLPAAEELYELYRIRCAAVGPNRTCIRRDEPDRLGRSADERDTAAVGLVADLHRSDQPVLVATQSVAESERFGSLLAAAGLTPAVLNAKNDAEEAAVIARAGRPGQITVSTQMAGRGTDIRLADGVAELGGLCVVGLGRFPSHRLDLQLRGRAGRQGDPGRSVYFVSPDDDVVVENGDAPAGELDDEGLRALVEHSQRAAEARQQDLRRLSARYGRLLATQRDQFLELRHAVLTADRGMDELKRLIPDRLASLVDQIGDQPLRRSARVVVLSSLDRRWSEHLAYVTELREGIHLRALAREDPLYEFNRLVQAAYAPLIDRACAEAAGLVERAPVRDGGLDLDAVELYRPGATWTYMVTDDHFGSEWERIGRFALRHLR